MKSIKITNKCQLTELFKKDVIKICNKCNKEFEIEDTDLVIELGICPYCGENIENIIIERDKFIW